MPRAKKNKSKEVAKHDGRSNNKRLPKVPLVNKGETLPVAKNNKAKRDRIASYAVNAMKAEFGSEKDAFAHLCVLARKNFNHMKLLLEYAYGRPSDNISDSGGGNKSSAPIIQFIKNEFPEAKQVIDITEEDE